MHMPRWASCLTLILEATRVEPLQAPCPQRASGPLHGKRILLAAPNRTWRRHALLASCWPRGLSAQKTSAHSKTDVDGVAIGVPIR